MTAGPNNQLLGAYTYDTAGNMLHDATSNLNYSYDQENRITGAAGYTDTYDGDGNRVKKSNGSTGTLYWYLSPGIVAESDLSGNLQSEYVFFDGERVARKDFPAGAVSYYFSDHLKTASVVTDASDNIKEDEDYYPWGGELQFVNNDSNHYKFTGKERDSESGLDYFGARYYSNGLGRFITPDWSENPEPVPYADLGDPQSLNQYSYVRNIPTTRVDADGHQSAVVAEPVKQAVKTTVKQLFKQALKTGATALAADAVAAAGPAVEIITFVVVFEGHTASGSHDVVPPPTQTQNQTEETEHAEEPAPASGGAQQGNGRGGKQARLRELGKDDKVSSADRGEITRDQNQIARGTRSTIRVPGNKDLAHRRGKEARKGHSYKHADLQNKDLHKLQHKHEGYK